METIEDFQNDIIRVGLAKPSEMTGCSQEEIERLMIHQGVNHLPPFYREFLERMGKNSGKYEIGARFLFDDLFSLKEQVQAIAKNADWVLPDDAFVFSGSIDNQFLFFQTEESDDPAVYIVENNTKTEYIDSFKLVLEGYFLKAVGLLPDEVE